MTVAVDSNILFSALLKEHSKHAETIFLADESWVAPKFAMVELFKYKEKITRYSQMPEERLLQMLHQLLKRIQFINVELLPLHFRKQAYEMCQGVDEKDTPFVALALAMEARLWTGDKKLIKGLKAKGFDLFYGLEE